MKVFVDGQYGTTGLKIHDRLNQRNDVELLSISEEHKKDPEIRIKFMNEADIVFLCLPDQAAREALTLITNPNTRVIDSSTAFRTKQEWLRLSARSAFRRALRGPILTSKNNEPDAEWIPLEFPVGPEGKQGTMGHGYISGYNVVPITSKNPDAVVRMLNFMNGDGYRTLLLGFENEVWSMKDGKIVTDFEKHNEHIYRQTLGESIRPYGAKEERDRLDSLGMEFKLNDNIDRIEKVAIRDQFFGVPTPGMGTYKADLQKLEEEYFTKIVVGKLPIDAFDEFVAEWKKKGGDEITAEVNAWYAENK
ncbi:hypothetical protein [Paenibacillus sp. LHD-38]|uniref:hypothetical protein n=1 Tax=Paenibacillus sp. LHD-38 TaxID=3072143 RepID=UPI00280CF0C2|nr:hypothetical protein [Paenibacillus sp. LHD-38]MDQ8738578.1 hypothetical protein [Paenibacillus sp. LHD-38]